MTTPKVQELAHFFEQGFGLVPDYSVPQNICYNLCSGTIVVRSTGDNSRTGMGIIFDVEDCAEVVL